MSTFLITGATGRQGGSAARILLSKDYKVHALVRDDSSAPAISLKSLGAALFKGELSDATAVTAAMKGVTGVFLNTFPNFTNPNGEAEEAQTCIEAARAAGTVTTIVVSTVFKANCATEIDPAEFPFLSGYYMSKFGAENVVRESGFAYTILRPSWLMHNYIAIGPMYHFPDYIEKHILTVSYPEDYRLEHLDAADVGKFAAAAFLEPEKFSGKEIDLGYETLTFAEIAQHLSAVTGVEITVKYRTKEETEALKEKMPTLESQLWSLKSKKTIDQKALAEYGIKFTTFNEFLEREKSAVKETIGV
ncbi:NAD dependent epimerase/dehydratase [Mycena floridula]|nr:NAD dependent epimerase/dehydratase [Mycena floridula]